jgi:uncharacterized protein
MTGVRRLPMFPLSTVLFPTMPLPLHVFEPRYRALVADCLAGDGSFGVVLITRGSEVGGGDERVRIGTLAVVESAQPFPDGRWHLVARGTTRLQVTRWLAEDPYPTAEIRHLPSPPAADGDELRRAESAVRRVRALLSELGGAPALAVGGSFGQTPDEVAWRLCALAPLGPLDRQRLLELDDPGARLKLLVELVDAVGADVRRILSGG